MANPEQPQVITSLRKSWVETLSSDPASFEKGLSDLGLSENTIKSDLDAYQAARRHLEGRLVDGNLRFRSPDDWERKAAHNYAKMKAGFTQAVKDIIARREYLIEDSELRELKVPVFWLTCPSAKHSKVQYKEELTEEVSATLTITVFGTGMGANQTIKMSYLSEFEATSGEYKTIFVSYPLRVYLIGVYERGSLVSKGLRSEVPIERQNDVRLGVESETAAASDIAYRSADVVEKVFELSGDTTKAVHTFSRAEEQKGEVHLKSGLKAFDLDLSSSSKIYRGTKIKLTFKLPAGFDYRLMLDRNGTGIWWK